ncbi:Major pollen allergen Bet v 1-D/H, putative [Ricinus communis]|uniref:Major pollen allergen Bet v 1-D/H, putative n=2 Tax=Ricinus communis TaxID=3988 RepID=B9RTB7_RICCO|nr:Major pollen allergen Bet v 1-D/H, putative [Ricinus communis]|eukprot:XP_002516986.1 major pollen allergen Bet v 1-G [Ricinus communis]
MPKLLPGIISSIDILEGDGGVGTIKKFNFTNAVKECSYVKDRVEVMDEENRIFTYSIVEGGILGLKVKSYIAEVSFTSTNEGGCLAKLKIQYESMSHRNDLLSEEDIKNIKKGFLAMVKVVDAFLLANPSSYV